MRDFNYYLETIGEIGFIEEIRHSVVYASGLPNAHQGELIIFESGGVGEVFSIGKKFLEILTLTVDEIKVGGRLARTDELLQIPVGESFLGRAVDPIGRAIDKKGEIKFVKYSPIDSQPHGIVGRLPVQKPLETGVTIVDLVVPIARGQRELIIGDRKTGKTDFLLQTLYTQARQGTICIYAIIGQKFMDIKAKLDFIKEKEIHDKTLIVATSPSDSSGLIYLTPYSAMTHAEYFRSKGLDVLLILDDMTTHAKSYREISLLAKRFPGRSSYPGDIFFVQSRLLERAGNFKRGCITTLPVAETLMGDLSGYIQTNLMSMTDGHIFFDIDLYNQGKRPAVNPFLSVTRIGHQVQTPLARDLSKHLLSFLIKYEKMKQFMRFGAEAGETVRGILELGKKLDIFFDQSSEEVIPPPINLCILASLFAGVFSEVEIDRLKSEMQKIIINYDVDSGFRESINDFLSRFNNFSDIVNSLRQDSSVISINKEFKK